MFNKLPSVAVLKDHFDYDPDTGIFTHNKPRCSRIKSGDLAGNVSKNGYLTLTVYGKKYYAHRVAWKMYYGEDPKKSLLDHKNRIKTDNRIDNLRMATDLMNKHNNNGTGITKSGDKWIAQIGFKREKLYLGTFDCPLMAHFAYLDKRAELVPGV